MNHIKNRRSFIKLGAASVAGLTGLSAIPAVVADDHGNKAEKLSESDPLAVALGYKEDTNNVDKTKYPTHSSEQLCVNCALYQGDDPEWGACGAFQNKLVAGPGWCQAWVAKPS